MVGRDHELDEIDRRLGLARLVTVTGPGGIGKTALARAVSRTAVHRYPEGAHWVDLTVVDDEAEVGSAVAAQLGFGSFGALLDSPADEPALVVVDNCEHVLDAASDAVAEMIHACDATTVLATSRSPLGLGGESVVVLGPLHLPGVDGDDLGSPAVQLFLRRARDAGATIPDGEVPVVGQLVQLLDGVPLAIELAAARSRVLSPSELLDRLGDLDTLRRQRPRGPARHRSVRDTIAWSLDLLGEGDRRFFHRLAVLSGPFTADDACAVAGEGDEVDAIDRLDRLVADSLLSTSVIAGVTYHRQLELVRSYARERLVDSGGWDGTWQRFVDRVTDRSVELSTSAASGWSRLTLSTLLNRVEQHLAVLRWCLERDEQPSRTFVLVATLWGVVHQGSSEEIAPLAERALERWDDPSSPGWSDAAATVATCRYLSGRPQEAIDLALLASEHAGDSPYAPCTLRRVVGHSRVALGDLEGAAEILSEAIELAADRVPSLAMEMRVSRAEVMATAGGPDVDVGPLLQEVRTVAADAAAVGSVVNEVWARSVEATLLARRDPNRAREVASQALSTARSSLYPAAESVNLHTLASLCVDDGDLPAAAGLVRDLVDGLVAWGARCELRNALRMAAVVLERAGRPTWEPVAATALTYPVVSLFAVPGHEQQPLPDTDSASLEPRDVLRVVRGALDEVSGRGARVLSARGLSAEPPHEAAVEAIPAAAGEPTNAWMRDGDLWAITFDGSTLHVRHSKGVADIGRLVSDPGVEVHCADLAGVAVEERSSGEVIDERSRREYEQRVRDLQAEIEEAEANSDHARSDKARAELDAIVDHLTSALGLGGRARRHTDSVERARSAVTQRIRSTIKRLRAVHPALAAHLEASVRTGTFCCYRPEKPTSWSTDPWS